MASKIVAHSFKARDGRQYKVVDDPGSRLSPTYLEHNGVFVEPCHTTGPEILKLAEQGQELWAALDNLVEVVAAREDLSPEALGGHDHAIGHALKVLRETAATFDLNEPEPESAPPRRLNVHDLAAILEAWTGEEDGLEDFAAWARATAEAPPHQIGVTPALVQRTFRVGFSRARRLLEALEARGREKMLYIGAVALLVRLHNSLGSAFVSAAAVRADFDADGDPLARLAADFNTLGFGVKVIENGSSFALVVDEARKPSPRHLGAPIPLVPEGGA
jgi:hypothetical protein